MEREQIIQIGLRVSEEINEKLEKRAQIIGISKNALILVLIHMGEKVLDSPINFHLPK